MANMVEYGRQEARAASKAAQRKMIDWFSMLLREELEKAAKSKNCSTKEVVERIEEKLFQYEQEICKDELDGR